MPLTVHRYDEVRAFLDATGASIGYEPVCDVDMYRFEADA